MAIDDSKAALWKAMQEKNGFSGGNGGGHSGHNDGGLGMKDYVDAKTEATEARLLSKLEQLSTKSTIWGAVATGTAIILAVLAFAGDRFDAGMSTADQRAMQIERDDKQEAAVRSINDKLDKLISNKK